MANQNYNTTEQRKGKLQWVFLFTPFFSKLVIYLLFCEMQYINRPLSAVRSKSDCRSRGCKFVLGPVPYLIDHEIISTVILLPLIQEGLLSVTSKSMCMKYWLNA